MAQEQSNYLTPQPSNSIAPLERGSVVTPYVEAGTFAKLSSVEDDSDTSSVVSESSEPREPTEELFTEEAAIELQREEKAEVTSRLQKTKTKKLTNIVEIHHGEPIGDDW